MLQGEHYAILSTFIRLRVAIKTFVLSIFEWPFYTGFTVCDAANSQGIEGLKNDVNSFIEYKPHNSSIIPRTKVLSMAS